MTEAHDEYSEMPDDDEQAFVYLESMYRTYLNDALEASENGNSASAVYLEYINKTIAAAKALNIPDIQDTSVPNYDRVGWDCYRQFSTDVDHYLIQIRIKRARRSRGYSVAFDPPTKEKIRHYLNQIRSIVERLDKISNRKREALYARINALANEADRNRTKYEIYAALAIELSSTTGTVARNLRPAGGLLDRIAKLFGSTKEVEETTALPAPQKRLEPPRENATPSQEDSDGEIPF